MDREVNDRKRDARKRDMVVVANTQLKVKMHNEFDADGNRSLVARV